MDPRFIASPFLGRRGKVLPVGPRDRLALGVFRLFTFPQVWKGEMAFEENLSYGFGSLLLLGSGDGKGPYVPSPLMDRKGSCYEGRELLSAFVGQRTAP